MVSASLAGQFELFMVLLVYNTMCFHFFVVDFSFCLGDLSKVNFFLPLADSDRVSVGLVLLLFGEELGLGTLVAPPWLARRSSSGEIGQFWR